jgi:hypothetical protein
VNDTQKAQASGTADQVKLAAAILLVIGGIAAYYIVGTSVPMWLRWLAVALGVARAAAAPTGAADA